MKIEIKFKDWQKIEYLAYQLQWFYVWSLNHQQAGNMTNLLESYLTYKTDDDESVKPHLKTDDLKWLKQVLNHLNQPKIALRGKNDSVPANLSSNHKMVLISKNNWSVIKHQVKLFLKVYLTERTKHHLLHVSQPSLQVFSQIFDKINSKNHLPDTQILDKALAGESINSAYGTIVNNNTSLKKKGK